MNKEEKRRNKRIYDKTLAYIPPRPFQGYQAVIPYGLVIEKVIYNNPATIVLWQDGTKTVVKCQKGDTYNKETGLALAISKKALGTPLFHKTFNKFAEEDNDE